jgi:hypothetical protein
MKMKEKLAKDKGRVRTFWQEKYQDEGAEKGEELVVDSGQGLRRRG